MGKEKSVNCEELTSISELFPPDINKHKLDKEREREWSYKTAIKQHGLGHIKYVI